MPASPAATGRSRRRWSRNSPRANSRRASSPTTRKKNVIRPLFTQVRSSRLAASGPIRSGNTQDQNASYPAGWMLIQIRAETIVASRIRALPDSVRRKARSGVAAGPGIDMGTELRVVSLPGADGAAVMRAGIPPGAGQFTVGGRVQQGRELLAGGRRVDVDLEQPAPAVRVGIDQLGEAGQVVVALADGPGHRGDEVADALDRFDVATGLAGLDRLADAGRGHVDHIAERLLGEVGHSEPRQAELGAGPGPQVVGAVLQASGNLRHGSSSRAASGQPDGDGWDGPEARADGELDHRPQHR